MKLFNTVKYLLTFNWALTFLIYQEGGNWLEVEIDLKIKLTVITLNVNVLTVWVTWERIWSAKDTEGETLLTGEGASVEECAGKLLDYDSGTQSLNREVEEKKIQTAVHLWEFLC